MVQVSEVRLTMSESIFLSDETKNAANTGCIREAFCEIWRENRHSAAGGLLTPEP
jgi:hypothetical protein